MSEIFGNSIMGGGGLTNSKLALADAQPGDVRSGKKFYSGDKQLKTGTVNDVIPSPIIMKLDPEGKVTATVQPEEGFISTEKRTETLGLPTQSAGTVTPNISEQVAVHRGVYTVGDVKVAAVNGIIRVTFPNGSTCTCSNGSTTLTAAGGGTATFLVPTTGTWTLSATDGTLTAAKTVDITETMRSANIELSFFSATISITYPAASTCVITDSNSTTVASDTNADSTAKTWTATVDASGTYTITATATDGSGKTKSTTVSITADGQSTSATLTYETILWEAGSDQNASLTGGFAANNTNYVTIGDSTVTITGNRTYFGSGSNEWSYSGNFYTKQKVAKGEFKYLCANIITNTGTNANNKAWLYAADQQDFTESNTIARLEIPVTTGATGIFKMPLTGVTSAVLGIRVYGYNNLQTIVTDKIWLE